jgi:hypothetical protein
MESALLAVAGRSPVRIVTCFLRLGRFGSSNTARVRAGACNNC